VHPDNLASLDSVLASAISDGHSLQTEWSCTAKVPSSETDILRKTEVTSVFGMRRESMSFVSP
jgi:hypothetical protein